MLKFRIRAAESLRIPLRGATPEAGTSAQAPCAHDHAVGFYESEASLVASVAAFAGPVLRAGESFVLVATLAHRRQVAAALTRAGVDVRGAEAQGRYLVQDAATLLRSFMGDGGPD